MKKNKLFPVITIVGLMAVGAYLSSQDYGVGLSEAIAETDDSLLNSNCTANTPQAFAADLNYLVAANAPQRNGMPTFNNATISFNGGTAVNGDSAPNIGPGAQTYIGTGGLGGNLLITHEAPKSKISGLFCTANTQSTLMAKAKVSDASSSLQVSAQAATDPDNIWKAGNRLDNDITGKMLFGAASVIGSNSPITDGGDAESLATGVNGEVVFATNNPAAGGYELQVLMKVQGGTLINQSEELTMTFTPS